MSYRVSPCKVLFLVFFFLMYTTKASIGIATVNTIVCWICWSLQAWSGIYLSLKATNTSESSAVHIFKTRTTVIADLVLLKTFFSCTGYVGVRNENVMARFCLGIAAYFLSIRPDVMNIYKSHKPGLPFSSRFDSRTYRIQLRSATFRCGICSAEDCVCL